MLRGPYVDAYHGTGIPICRAIKLMTPNLSWTLSSLSYYLGKHLSHSLGYSIGVQDFPLYPKLCLGSSWHLPRARQVPQLLIIAVVSGTRTRVRVC